MFLFNPFYIISNVIYIVPSRRYVLVEKKCWNTLFRKVFHNQAAEPEKIRALKELIYSTYVSYNDNQVIDYQLFNSKISVLQEITQPLDPVTIPVSQPYVELQINEETYVEEFLDDSRLGDVNLSSKHLDLINSKKSSYDQFRNELRLLLDMYISRSRLHDDTVKIIGYNFIFVTLCRFFIDGSISINSPILFDFLTKEKEFIALCLRFMHIDFWYSCPLCETINCHDRTYHKKDPLVSNHINTDTNWHYRDKKIYDHEIKFNYVTDTQHHFVANLRDYVDINTGCCLIDSNIYTTLDEIINLIKMKLIDQYLSEKIKTFNSVEKANIISYSLDESNIYCDRAFYDGFYRFFEINGLSSYSFLLFYKIDEIVLLDKYDDVGNYSKERKPNVFGFGYRGNLNSFSSMNIK